MHKLLLLGITLLAGNTVFSQGFQVNFQGQKQQGMGGAGNALPVDAASVFFNPGSVSFLKENSVNIGFTPTFANTLFEDANSTSIGRTNSPMGTPFSAYAVYRKKEESKFFFGLGIYTPFGSTIQYEDGWTGRFALTKLQLKSIFIQPTLSYKLNDKIGIGAGFVCSIGNVNLQKDIPVQDADGNYGHAELDGKASGFGYNVGLFVQATEKLNIGLSYRSQVNMEVAEGTATFTVPSSLSSNFPSGTFSSALPLPQVATLGLAYKLNDKLAFALDVNYVGWKAYDTLDFDYAQNTASLIDTKSARNYKNTLAFRLGANYAVTEKFDARLGIAYGLTPVQNGYVTPETPDANRINYTAGLGYKIGEHFQLDASVFFTHLKRTDTNLETNLSGTYTTNVIAPGLAIIYKF
ncbi:MAG: long-chain fatty acid transporter [Crocinitomicaceae bacterium]|nr:MAG: long-chain fatty acid transporter [Crocinitomicaceae bacterium]